MNTAKLKAAAERQKSILAYIASYEPADIDSDTVDLRFEDENGCATGCDVSIVEECRRSADLVGELIAALEAAQKLNAELDDRLLRYAGIATQRAEHVAELEKRVAELENDEVRQRLANAEHQIYMAELEARKLELIIPQRLGHDYAAVAVQQRDEQWHKALHDACDRAGINLETGGEA
ncbi:hypothetical protein ACMSZU_001069 [Cronobacter dublinensis]